VICEFDIIYGEINEMVESEEIVWNIGENVVGEFECSEMSTCEKGRRIDFS
jgi:hypothetical protein